MSGTQDDLLERLRASFKRTLQSHRGLPAGASGATCRFRSQPAVAQSASYRRSRASGDDAPVAAGRRFGPSTATHVTNKSATIMSLPIESDTFACVKVLPSFAEER